APMYYFVLRPYLEEHYVREASFGRYDVYRRRTADGPPPAPPADEPPLGELDRDALFARLADPDRDLRRAATAAFLARARTREGVTALATAWAPDESSRLLLIRNLGEGGDERAVDFLAETYDRAGMRLRHEVAAGTALVTLGRLEHLTSLVGLLAIAKHDVQDWVPAFLIEMAGRHPVEVAAALRHGLAHADARVRETSAWVAGAADATALGP